MENELRKNGNLDFNNAFNHAFILLIVLPRTDMTASYRYDFDLILCVFAVYLLFIVK